MLRRTKSAPLTERTLQAMKPGDKLTDGQLPPGHGRMVAICSAKADGTVQREFYFKFYAPAETTMLIGLHGKVSLESARADARALRDLWKQGINPKQHRAQVRADNQQRQRDEVAAAELEKRKGTLRHLIKAYVDDLRRRGKNSADDTERTLRRHVLEPFPALADRPASEITADHVSDILARMIAAGIERRVNIVRANLSAAFAFGAHQDNDPRRKARALVGKADDQAAKVFGLTANPVTLVRAIAEFNRAGDRILDDDELRYYWSALDELHPAVGGCLRVSLLLGGQRLSQLKRLKWEDWSGLDMTLALRDAKGRGDAREHLLPVSTAVRATLDQMRVLSPEGYVFSTTQGRVQIDLSTLSSAVTEISREFSKMRAAQRKAPPFSAKDIRRTVETRMARMQISKDIRAQVLSHGRTANVQDRHYDRYKYLPEKQAALARWEAHLDQVRNGAAPRVVRGVFREA